MEKLIPEPKKITIKASDLRGILEYVPLYQNQTFVISMDGSVIACDNFSDVITDIAVLRSLGINVVVVHGIGAQMRRERDLHPDEISDTDGTKPVNDATLDRAKEISATLSQTIIDAFATRNMNCVLTNAIRATEVGIVSGVDYLNAGRIEKVDFAVLKNLLSLGMIPVITPMAVNSQGRLFRINSDSLAADIAIGLGASKLIYMTETRGLMLGDERAVAFPLAEVKQILRERGNLVDPRVLSKAKCSIKALEAGRTPRAHILDGRDFACLLTELFDKVGCATMIYADEYQKIRSATSDDVAQIFNITSVSAKTQNLIYRSREDIAEKIGSYFVYEMDASIIGVVSLLDIGDNCAELASLHVQPFYQGNGVGRKMVEYVKMKARERGYKRLYCLSTKSAPFFTGTCGFSEVSPDALPAPRYEKYKASGRNSKVFLFPLEK